MIRILKVIQHHDFKSILSESYLNPKEYPKLTFKDGVAFVCLFVALVSLLVAVFALLTSTFILAGICGAVASVGALVFNHFSKVMDFQSGKTE